MRRRKLRWVVAGLAVLLAVGAFVLWPLPDRVTQENFDRITVGMNRAEVEAILGGPPGDYRTVPTRTYPRSYPHDIDGVTLYRSGCCCSYDGPVDESSYEATWVGNEGIIQVEFSSGVVPAPHARGGMGPAVPGIFPSKHFIPTVRLEQSLRDDFLWLAKRQWRRFLPK